MVLHNLSVNRWQGKQPMTDVSVWIWIEFYQNKSQQDSTSKLLFVYFSHKHQITFMNFVFLCSCVSIQGPYPPKSDVSYVLELASGELTDFVAGDTVSQL